jgi:hypothetical protein
MNSFIPHDPVLPGQLTWDTMFINVGFVSVAISTSVSPDSILRPSLMPRALPGASLDCVALRHRHRRGGGRASVVVPQVSRRWGLLGASFPGEPSLPVPPIMVLRRCCKGSMIEVLRRLGSDFLSAIMTLVVSSRAAAPQQAGALAAAPPSRSPPARMRAPHDAAAAGRLFLSDPPPAAHCAVHSRSQPAQRPTFPRQNNKPASRPCCLLAPFCRRGKRGRSRDNSEHWAGSLAGFDSVAE